MLIFTKLIYLTNEAYFEFSASVFKYIYLTDRELCHHQNLFKFLCRLFALPRSFYVAVTCSETQPVGVDGRQSTKQMQLFWSTHTTP